MRALADERTFRPGLKTLSFAAFPDKRSMEMSAILAMTRRGYTGGAPWRRMSITGRTEAATAAALGEASVFLSLSRLEGLGMSTPEAMASGCLVVGFAGTGGTGICVGAKRPVGRRR